MKSFQNFHEYQVLEESLNTPVEFHLTDDTQVPNRIYGAFNLDDDTYGMSLEQSDHQGIYILNMYRILAKKPRKWSFKKPSHIRPALSTLLKFLEASTPFVKSQMRGIICKVSGKNTERYVSFAERILKRSYITSFKVLPTTKSPDQKKYAWENIFISRIGVSPSVVFSDKKFKKYDFSDGILSHEASADISPKRPEKKTLKTEPSKRYTFGQLEIENITIDSEIFDLITKVEKDTSVAKESKKTASGKNVIDDYNNLTDDNKEFLRYFRQDAQKKKIANFLDLTNQNPSMILTALVRTFLDENPNALVKNTGDIQGIIEYIFSAGSNRHTKKYFEMLNIMDPILGVGYSTLKKIYDNLQNGLPKKTAQNKAIQIINQYEKTIPKRSYVKDSSVGTSIGGSPVIFKTNIDPEQLLSTTPGQGDFIYSGNFHDMYHGKTVNGIDMTQSANYVEKTLGYYKEIQSNKSYDTMYAYTGSTYKEYNASLREAFVEFNNSSQYMKYSKTAIDGGDADLLSTMFNDMKPLPESMWVYRETDLPQSVVESIESGNDFVDPAFLSTSLNPGLNWGGWHKFRIYVPKGSSVIPALNSSKNYHEKEIILPAFSVLKVIRIDEFGGKSSGRLFVTCIFVGSVYKDFKRQFMEKLSTIGESKNYNLFEAKKKKKDEYDPKDKFGVQTDAETLSAALKFVNGLKKK